MSDVRVVSGPALYLRHFTKSRHGTQAAFAKRVASSGMQWIAIAGMWQSSDKTKFINRPEVCRELSYELGSAGVIPFVWGYPWQGREREFAEGMAECLPLAMKQRILIDPELGVNPGRYGKGYGKTKANASARLIVAELDDLLESNAVLGLSTFGSGVQMRWFPLFSFVREMLRRFNGRCFAGGQTYTSDAAVDTSIAQFIKMFKQLAGEDWQEHIQFVPNFGLYSKGTKTRYRAKTPDELFAHFLEFVDEDEPVHAMIGWAENFVKPPQWAVLKRMALLMERGATSLPSPE